MTVVWQACITGILGLVLGAALMRWALWEFLRMNPGPMLRVLQHMQDEKAQREAPGE